MACRVSLSSVCCRLALCTSTTGVSPLIFTRGAYDEPGPIERQRFSKMIGENGGSGRQQYWPRRPNSAAPEEYVNGSRLLLVGMICADGDRVAKHRDRAAELIVSRASRGR